MKSAKISRSYFIKSVFLASVLTLFGSQLKASQKSIKGQTPKDDITRYGAISDGKTDVTKFVKKALAENSSAYIPASKHGFIVGNLNLNSQVIHGVGKIVRNAKSSHSLIIKGKGSRVQGLTFEAPNNYKNSISDIKLDDGSQDIHISNCTFASSQYSAIVADKNSTTDKGLKYKKKATSVIISNNIFNGKYSRPLYLHSIDTIIIDRNIFKNTLFDAIRLRQNIIRSTITNNQFFNIGTAKTKDSQDAIDTYWSGEELIISNNIFKKCSKNALEIKGLSPNDLSRSGKVIINANEILDAKYSGIHLSSGASIDKRIQEIIISNNIIKGSGANNPSHGNSGIFIRHGVSDVIINSNIISNNNSRGIFIANIEEKTTPIRNITITNNQITNNGNAKEGYGIISKGVKGLVISGNNINTDNKLQKVAIAITEAKNSQGSAVITNNMISDTHKHKILLPKKNKSNYIEDKNLIN